eukprot:g3225.t1
MAESGAARPAEPDPPWTVHESDGHFYWYSDPELGGDGTSTWENPEMQAEAFAPRIVELPEGASTELQAESLESVAGEPPEAEESPTAYGTIEPPEGDSTELQAESLEPVAGEPPVANEPLEADEPPTADEPPAAATTGEDSAADVKPPNQIVSDQKTDGHAQTYAELTVSGSPEIASKEAPQLPPPPPQLQSAVPSSVGALPSLPPPPPIEDRRPTLPPRPMMADSGNQEDEDACAVFMVAIVNRRGNIEGQANLTVNMDEKKFYFDIKSSSMFSKPVQKVYAASLIEKLERHRSKAQFKFYICDGTQLKVLFASSDARETFGALATLINPNIWTIYEGEWVDEISDAGSETTYMCYRVSRSRGAMQTEKRVLCVDVESARVLVVDPSLYDRYCGREAAREASQHRRSSKLSHESTPEMLFGLERMKKEIAYGERTWTEIKVDANCVIKVHSKLMHTHGNVQLHRRLNTGGVSPGAAEELSAPGQSTAHLRSRSVVTRRSFSSSVDNRARTNSTAMVDKVRARDTGHGRGNDAITFTVYANGMEKSPTRKEEFTFASATVCARFCGYLNPHILGIHPSTILERGWKTVAKCDTKLSVFITTWNVGETKPLPSLGAYFPWLRPQQGGRVKLELPNIFVIGLQECKKGHRSLWLRSIRDAIDDAVSQNREDAGNRIPHSSGRGSAYKLVSSIHMVQMSLYVFAAPENAREITDVRTESVPTGLGGVYGNKGCEDHVAVHAYMGLQDLCQSDHRPVVFQAHVKTQLPYINIHAPSRFMGGKTCDMCFVDARVVVEELEEVVERMNDDFDEMSDVINPNPKKSKNPINKLVKKLSKILKKKKKKKKTVVRALNEPAADVPGDLNTVEAQWEDGQMPVIVPAVGDVAYVRNQMILVAISKKCRGAKTNKWAFAGVASISIADADEDNMDVPSATSARLSSNNKSTAADLALDSAEGEENTIRVPFGPTDVRLSGVTVGYISGTILVRSIDRTSEALQRKGSAMKSHETASESSSSGWKQRSRLMKRLKRQSEHFGSLKGESLLDSMVHNEPKTPVSQRKKKGRGSFNWRKVKDKITERPENIADVAIAKLMSMRSERTETTNQLPKTSDDSAAFTVTNKNEYGQDDSTSIEYDGDDCYEEEQGERNNYEKSSSPPSSLPLQPRATSQAIMAAKETGAGESSDARTEARRKRRASVKRLTEARKLRLQEARQKARQAEILEAEANERKMKERKHAEANVEQVYEAPPVIPSVLSSVANVNGDSRLPPPPPPPPPPPI